MGCIGRENEAVAAASMYYCELLKVTLQADRDGLTKTQLDILLTVDTMGAMSVSAVGERLAISKEHMSRSIKPLCERGLLEKNRDDGNRRMVVVSLSPQGRAFLSAHQEKAHRRLDEILERLAPEERAELRQCAARSVDLLSKALGNPCPECQKRD